MEEYDMKQTLFRKKPKQTNRDGCRMCRKKYRKCINTCLTWEVVILVVHILVFLIVIFKLAKDGKLGQIDKPLFRSYKSGGHVLQGVLFVLLIVPFRFNKRLIKWFYNFYMKNETHMDDECREGQRYQQPYGDIEENKMGNYLSNEEDEEARVSEKNCTMNTLFGSFGDNHIDQGGVGDQAANSQAVNNGTVMKHSADASEMDAEKRDGHTQFSHIGSTNSAKSGNGMEHQNGSGGKNPSGECLTTNRRRKGSNCSSGSLHHEHTKGKISSCEYFINSLIFPLNTPKHTREKIQYFFLCAKLYANNKSSFLFVLKYVCSFILMFGYPLYNLVKRKLLHINFYLTSYYRNAFDFAAGLLVGSLFVFIYGVVKFFANLYMNRNNDKFYFYDNYPFMGEVKCLCDENVRILIHNNPHLKGIAIQYLNTYGTYKSLLLVGILILFVVSICSFVFTLTSMSTPVPVAT
ncbi:hypothetical protein AK88_04370 [Plasmodium fragile]|uniref:Uncharacterized protein n=1 Tax=Plasmodium fragile TaxID=5857 RepID=A0A0D9QJQ2_PLAFR|nr:uncharacterized protein AK88_04370 [Plasmodium fragile]KJP85961.1 hypothetical protein AK88_04370 [Plasmodium fragile]